MRKGLVRLLIVVVLLGVVMSLTWRPVSVAEASAIGGSPSNGCVQYWRAADLNSQGWVRFLGQFRLDVVGAQATVQAQWLDSRGYQGGMYWHGAGTHFATLENPVVWQRDELDPASEIVSLVVFIPQHEHYAGTCFTLSSVVVWRYPAVVVPHSPSPAPTNTPGPTPTECYETSQASCGSPPAGSCWVLMSDGNGQPIGWTARPCTTPGPTATAPPSSSGEGCPDIRTGSGTWHVEFQTTSGACILWASWIGASGNSATLQRGTTGQIWRGTSGTIVSPCLLWRVVSGTEGVVPAITDVTSGGGAAIGCGSVGNTAAWVTLGTGSNNVSNPASGNWLVWYACTYGSGCNTGGAASPYGTGLRAGSGGGTYELTVSRSGTWGDPEVGDPEWTPPPITMPPAWPSPDPGQGGLGAPQNVEICAPGSIASSRSACQTWPPQGSGSEPCAPGSASADSIMCSTPGPAIPSPGAIPTFGVTLPEVGTAWSDLQDSASDRAPFVWAGEVAEVLGDALDAGTLAGADLGWCVDVGEELGGELCFDDAAAEMASTAAPLRPVLLGLLGLVLAWVVAHRIWGTVGGSGSGSGE